VTVEPDNPPVPPSDSQAAAPASPTPPPRRFGTAQALLLLLLAAAAAALFWPRDSAAPGLKPGGFTVDATGRPEPLARQFREVTLVHFWATWCPPCRTEIPSLLAWARQARSDRLAIVLVAVADDPAVAARFVGPTDLPLLYDPSWEVAHRFGTLQLPETHIVVGGRIVDSFIGATDWSDPAVRARVQKWTASPTRPTP
jgi:thiol-disulfide isomerase/thioredoxin